MNVEIRRLPNGAHFILNGTEYLVSHRTTNRVNGAPLMYYRHPRDSMESVMSCMAATTIVYVEDRSECAPEGWDWYAWIIDKKESAAGPLLTVGSPLGVGGRGSGMAGQCRQMNVEIRRLPNGAHFILNGTEYRVSHRWTDPVTDALQIFYCHAVPRDSLDSIAGLTPKDTLVEVASDAELAPDGWDWYAWKTRNGVKGN